MFSGLAIGRLLSRNWEWIVIALLVVGGYGLVQKAKLDRFRAETAVAQVAQLTAERDALRDTIKTTTAALRERERTLNALREQADADRAALASIPDDGCLDRRMPSDVQRLLIQPGKGGARPAAAADARTATASGADRRKLAGPGAARDPAAGSSASGGSRQGSSARGSRH